MDPSGKIPKKFTKEFGSKVINIFVERPGFCLYIDINTVFEENIEKE